MKKRILAVVMSVVMLLTGVGAAVGFTSADDGSVSVGKWLAMVDSEFGMSYYEQAEPYFESVPADSKYFAAVQTAAEWGIVSTDEKLDISKALKADFMAATLVRAAKLSGESAAPVKNADRIAYADEVAVAAANGIVALKANGSFKNTTVTLDAAVEALQNAKTIWSSKTFEEDVALVKTSDKVKDLTGEAECKVEEAYKETKTVVNAATGEEEQTEVLKEVVSILASEIKDKIKVNDVCVLPATRENPFGSIRKVTKIVAEDSETVTVECEPAELDEVFDEINMESTFSPDFQTAQITDNEGTVINETDVKATEGFDLIEEGIATSADDAAMVSLLKNQTLDVQSCTDLSKKPINIGFNVGGYYVSGRIEGNTMDFSVGGYVGNAYVTKSYTFNNFNVSTKADVSLIKAKINEAYIRLDYDVKDSTKVEGNYNKVLGDYNWKKDYTAQDIDAATGSNALTSLENAAIKAAQTINNKITIASINVPIPGMPVISICIDVNLKFNMDGSVELVLESNQSRGYEIINNKGRVISDTTYTQADVKLGADSQLTANFGIALQLLGSNLIDVGLETGIGVDANTTISFYDTVNAKFIFDITADVPIDIALTISQDAPYVNVSGNVKIYGILNASVGERSPILSKIGLSKTWYIFGKDNAVIYEYKYDKGNVPVPAPVMPEAEPTAPSAAGQVAASYAVDAGKTLALSGCSSWTSSNSGVAAVSADGVVTGVAAGTAIVTGTAADGTAVSFEIVVADVASADTYGTAVRDAYAPAANVFAA